jgi:hypothetical protein
MTSEIDMTLENTVTCYFPAETHRIYFLCRKKYKFSLAVSYHRLAELILSEGVNVICLCNLFSQNINFREKISENFLGFLHDTQPKKVRMYNTHTSSNCVLMTVEDPNTADSLEKLATVSFLRRADFNIETKNIECLSYPVRKLLLEGVQHKGKIETLLFVPALTNRNKRRTILGSYKWGHLNTCEKNCHMTSKQTEFVLNMSPFPLTQLPYPWNQFTSQEILKPRTKDADPTRKITEAYEALSYVLQL